MFPSARMLKNNLARSEIGPWPSAEPGPVQPCCSRPTHNGTFSEVKARHPKIMQNTLKTSHF